MYIAALQRRQHLQGTVRQTLCVNVARQNMQIYYNNDDITCCVLYPPVCTKISTKKIHPASIHRIPKWKSSSRCDSLLWCLMIVYDNIDNIPLYIGSSS